MTSPQTAGQGAPITTPATTAILPQSSTSGVFAERLRVPIRWWIIAAAASGVIWIAASAPLPPPAAWITTAVFATFYASGLIAYGSARVKVHDEGLTAGRARIAHRFLGVAEVLEAEEMRELSGPAADVRAFLVLRPYIRQGVRVQLTDPNDSTPYWLISSRRPATLAAALRAREAARHQGPLTTDPAPARTTPTARLIESAPDAPTS